ncbi:MAG: type III pantothenate kinase [Opitutae bacterium]|nr:type III pantothenate kinase [Opitutae bacterium]MCD8298211.1 type III pantothenate kinase [Opitutae bacterium]
MKIFCVDVGNTHAHYALMENRRALVCGAIETHTISSAADGVPAILASEKIRENAVDGIAFCSVVPRATERLLAALKNCTDIPVCRVYHENCPGLGINYPTPSEIGPDRLANCIGAQARFGAPAVIIDMGTAATFDVLSEKGYEGGIIAPGIGVMTRYLHEQTALLPELDPQDLLLAEDNDAIGKSTLRAMRFGCAVGFSGMIGALLETVLAEMKKNGIGEPCILATGGCAGILPRAWKSKIRWTPFITLQGLEEAFIRSTHHAE